ncbi:MAG: hypothetical protein ACRDZQ_12210, partial [Acidimicrobiales bacterium]
MTRLARLVNGLGALTLLTGLAAGVPWALWHFVGWPLPHHVPTAAQIGQALNRQGIPDQVLVDALAVVVWLTWATLVASLAAEIPAALCGRRTARLPVAGIFQPVTGHLVAAVVVACLAIAPRPGHANPPGGPGSGLSAITTPRPAAALVVRDPVLTAATGPLTGPPARTAADTTAAAPETPPPAATPGSYAVQRGDTLWGIA